MKKFGVILLLVLATLTGLTACGDEHADEAKVWRKVAEQNAHQYIKEKYNIKTRVTNAKSRMVSGLFFANSTEDTYLTLKDEQGKEFHVFISGKEPGITDGTDDYQKEVVMRDLQEIIYGAATNRPYECKMRYGSNMADNEYQNYMLGRKYECPQGDISQKEDYIKEYFEKEQENNKMSLYFVLSYLDSQADLNLEDEIEMLLNHMPNKDQTYMLGVSYHSLNELRNDNAVKSPEDIMSSMIDHVYARAPHISRVTEHVPYYKKTEIKNYTFSVGQMDDFYYMIPNVDVSSYQLVKEDMTQSEAEEFNGSGFINAQTTGVKYRIDGLDMGEIKNGAIYIYKKKSKEPLQITSKYLYVNKSGEEKPSYSNGFCNLHENFNEYDYYYIYGIQNPDYMFCFMSDQKK